jgi:hypothetical protein
MTSTVALGSGIGCAEARDGRVSAQPRDLSNDRGNTHDRLAIATIVSRRSRVGTWRAVQISPIVTPVRTAWDG